MIDNNILEPTRISIKYLTMFKFQRFSKMLNQSLKNLVWCVEIQRGESKRKIFRHAKTTLQASRRIPKAFLAIFKNLKQLPINPMSSIKTQRNSKKKKNFEKLSESHIRWVIQEWCNEPNRIPILVQVSEKLMQHMRIQKNLQDYE